MPAKPTFEELSELAASQAALIAQQAEAIAVLQAQVVAPALEVAELKRQWGRDSTNSGQPSSTDSIAVKARRTAEVSSRERSRDRKPGGQLGRKGVRPEPAERPERTERAADPGSAAAGAGTGPCV